jgi:hypothetical protein
VYDLLQIGDNQPDDPSRLQDPETFMEKHRHIDFWQMFLNMRMIDNIKEVVLKRQFILKIMREYSRIARMEVHIDPIGMISVTAAEV